MIWLKSSSFFPGSGPVVYVCTGPPSSLKIPAKLRTCCQSAFNAPLDNLEGLHMPGGACGVGKGWHRQALWLMHCLVCPWADSENDGSPLSISFFFLLYHLSASCLSGCDYSPCSLLDMWEMSALTIRMSNVGSEAGDRRVMCHFQTLKSHFKNTCMLIFLCCSWKNMSESNSTRSLELYTIH